MILNPDTGEATGTLPDGAWLQRVFTHDGTLTSIVIVDGEGDEIERWDAPTPPAP